MSKKNPMGGNNTHAPDRLLPLGFDENAVAGFFSQRKGLGKEVQDILETTVGKGATSVGSKVSAAAMMSKQSVVPDNDDGTDTREDSSVDFGAYLSTDQDDLLGHVEEHDHDAHDLENSDTDHFEFGCLS